DGNPESHVPVARCAGECQSVNAHPLASPRIPAVLALEVQTHGTTTPAKGPTTPDPRDGCGERHLGRGTHCQQTEAEARNPGLTPHRGALSARRRSGAHARSQAALADLHPTAEWTLQQFREALPGYHAYRLVIHDRDTIFSQRLDQKVTGLGVRVLRTPVRAPRANAVCERLGGSLRRECLDFLIPINERHLKMTVTEWVIHYNRGRPHSSLGPGLPEPNQSEVPASDHRHKMPSGYHVVKTSVLGGLHHEYRLVKEAA